mmetsp:Transcript_3653/g.11327  ORF Transcript_3653/g.11327 Transcript_3653/m.11327 type:complete len:113 (+) Transcript_3653:2892-3230(+)
MRRRWALLWAAAAAAAAQEYRTPCDQACNGGACVFSRCEDATCRGGACAFDRCARPSCDGAAPARGETPFDKTGRLYAPANAATPRLPHRRRDAVAASERSGRRVRARRVIP